jgi:hypothetical protein
MVISDHQESFQEGRQDIKNHIEMAIAQLERYADRNPRYAPGIKYSVDLLKGIVEVIK